MTDASLGLMNGFSVTLMVSGRFFCDCGVVSLSSLEHAVSAVARMMDLSGFIVFVLFLIL